MSPHSKSRAPFGGKAEVEVRVTLGPSRSITNDERATSDQVMFFTAPGRTLVAPRRGGGSAVLLYG
jgi:hypothetical protein